MVLLYIETWLTGKDSLSHPLVSHRSVALSRCVERSLEDELADSVLALELGRSLLQLFLVKVRDNVSYLDVGQVWIKLLHFDLRAHVRDCQWKNLTTKG